MPSITIACPHCGQTLTVDSSSSHSAVACRNCGQRFSAPDADAPFDLDLLAEQANCAPALSRVRLPTSKRARAAGRRRVRPGWVLLLLSAVALLSLTLTAVLTATWFINRPPAEPDYEASARAALAEALDKWLAGDDSDAWHWDAIKAILLDYNIHSLRPVNTELFDLSSEEWAKYEGPTAIYTDRPLTYLATVQVHLQSRAGTALPRVLLYRLTWLCDAKKWNIKARTAAN